MGLFSYLFDNDLMQRADIEALKQQQRLAFQLTGRSKAENVHVDSKLKAIDDEVGELALFCHTAISLMLEKGLITREEFTARMKQIDASDGKADGKFTES
jgi:hypothetical protein